MLTHSMMLIKYVYLIPRRSPEYLMRKVEVRKFVYLSIF